MPTLGAGVCYISLSVTYKAPLFHAKYLFPMPSKFLGVGGGEPNFLGRAQQSMGSHLFIQCMFD